jgi:hypothetical protein
LRYCIYYYAVLNSLFCIILSRSVRIRNKRANLLNATLRITDSTQSLYSSTIQFDPNSFVATKSPKSSFKSKQFSDDKFVLIDTVLLYGRREKKAYKVKDHVCKVGMNETYHIVPVKSISGACWPRCPLLYCCKSKEYLRSVLSKTLCSGYS